MNPKQAPQPNTLDGLPASHHKVQASHLSRLAYIYIRQSTAKQVRHNQESQRYQRQLSERAQALGWPAERVRIIDSDLAQSAKDSVERSGFQRLVAEVSLGHVGIVFAYEVSRLARNNSDWYQLLDLAAVFDTLLADSDGLYHPRLYNDRLLLGLKGNMSEAELHLLRQRLEAGRLSQVKRGVYRQRLPTGLLRQADGQVVKDPDVQVRQALELIFRQFEQLGSCRQVRRYFRREKLLIPRRQTTSLQAGALHWRVASDAAINDILHNPAYAGAFVYGRSQLEPSKRRPGQPASGRVKKAMAEWQYVQPDRYPAYISWSQYLKNQETLTRNAMRFEENKQQAQGAPRAGAALLQGLVTCGGCGHRLQVRYKGKHRYACHGLTRTVDIGSCLSLPGPSIDKVVIQAFFEALQPAQLDALEAILAAQGRERQQLEQQWQARLQGATYQVHLAERQYNAVDPDNRLVAAALEQRWELALRQQREVQVDYESFQHQASTRQVAPELRRQFQTISKTLPELWPQLSHVQQKELLRSLIEQVILKRLSPDQVEVKIVWISGHYSLLLARPPILCQAKMSGREQFLTRLKQLWQEGLSDEQIAGCLSKEGFRSARSEQVVPLTVQRIRLKQGWYMALARSRNALEIDGLFTVRGLAAHIGVEQTWVYQRIYRGVIDPELVQRHPQGQVYLIQKDPAMLEKLRHCLPKNFIPREVL